MAPLLSTTTTGTTTRFVLGRERFAARYSGGPRDATMARRGSARMTLPLAMCDYFVIVPQAMRAPAFPAGSDFMSSAAA